MKKLHQKAERLGEKAWKMVDKWKYKKAGKKLAKRNKVKAKAMRKAKKK